MFTVASTMLHSTHRLGEGTHWKVYTGEPGLPYVPGEGLRGSGQYITWVTAFTAFVKQPKQAAEVAA